MPEAGRPPLPLGTWGEINRVRLDGGRWLAVARFRDFDGRTRVVTRRGPTGARAEARLRESFRERLEGSGAASISADTRLAALVPLYLDTLRAKGREASTLEAYEDSLRLHVVPALGALRLREISVSGADRFLRAITKNSGPGQAKRCRTVLSGMLAMAVRDDAIRSNPVRETSEIALRSKPARSLTLAEVAALRQGIRADHKAVRHDLPALVDFMLGTGMRIGEAIAVTWGDLDFERGTVALSGIIVRVRGEGVIRKPKAKSAAGWRTLHLPYWLVAQLRARPRVENEWDAVFLSPRGMLRDKSNTSKALHTALDPLGFDWVTTHTFRKTAATLMDAQGLTVREIADQLGHARVSITQDTYFGRSMGPERARAALAGLGDLGISVDFSSSRTTEGEEPVL